MSDGEVTEVIILMSAREAHRKPPVPESALVTADLCGHQAFMAPTTIAHLADGHPGVRTVCTACFNPGALPGYDLRLIPGTAAEAEATLGIAEADQLMAWARDTGFKDGTHA